MIARMSRELVGPKNGKLLVKFFRKFMYVVRGQLFESE